MTAIWNGASTTPAATHRVPVDVSSSGGPTRWTGQQIADLRAYVGGTVNNLGSINTNQSLSLADGLYIAATITGNVQFTFTSVPTGFTDLFLELTNAGAYTVSFAATIGWTGGTTPSLPAVGVALIHLYTRDGGTSYIAHLVSDEQQFDAAAIISGTLDAARLPAPTTTAIGGVKRNTGSAGQFVTGIDTDGSLLRDTPSGASPGGSGSELQYRGGASTFSAASGTHWDAANGRLSIGAGTSPAGMLHAQASAASVIPAVLQGAASQTANLQDWRDSSGSALVEVTASRSLLVNNVAGAERGFLRWSSNVFEIGTESLGSGTSRQLTLRSATGTTHVGAGNDQDQIFELRRNSGRYLRLTANASVSNIHSPIGLTLTSDFNSVGTVGGWEFRNTGVELNRDASPVTYAFTHGTRFTDTSARSWTITGGPAWASAATNVVGGNVSLIGGAGASGSAGAAHGGKVYLDGGQGYGTGSHGNVVIGATRGNLELADARNIQAGTTTGTKIGTATTQKLGFWSATPVVQPAAVADATDATTVIAQLNDLLAKLRTVGLIAT